jgi:hypothetical protein
MLPPRRRRRQTSMKLLGGEQCRIEYCVLNAMAKERLPALYVVVLAKNRSWVTQSLNARNAAVLASAVATCAVVLAKSSQLIQISELTLRPNR